MGSTNGKTTKVALVPLAKDTVLLPGVTQRIALNNRPDVANLLSTIMNRNRRESNTITIACVPLSSPRLSKDSLQLIENGSDSENQEEGIVDAGQARKEDLFKYGTLAKIVGVQRRVYAEPFLLVEGIKRLSVVKVLKERPFFEAEVMLHDEIAPSPKDSETVELFQHIKQLARELLTLLRIASLFPSASTNVSPMVARRFETYISRRDFPQAGSLADFMADIIETTLEEKLRILAAFDVKDRLERVIELLNRQVQGIKNNVKITSITTTSVPPNSVFGISQLDPRLAKRSMAGFNGYPPNGSGGGNEEDKEPNEVEELQQRLNEAQLTPEARKVADREIQRLRKMNPVNAEYSVCRSYIENLVEIPWVVTTEDQLGNDTLQRARKQLDDDHYGLEKIKKRLLEYLAVLKLKQSTNLDIEQQISQITKQLGTPDKGSEESTPLSEFEKEGLETKLHILKSKRTVDKSPILLLVGPPGTGKTSLAKSVATSLGRKFHRISLGGVRDEAEIRGHRRTYVAAMPGLIVNGLKKVGVANPVFLLDEIDKVGGSNFHGDPSAAMLEVLDPEQNHSFSDHYINIPIDLSKVLFIATANSLDTIPAPLLDRMETITLAGYTTVEKRYIARQHLLPKQIRINGLSEDGVTMADEVLEKIITAYTRESGVRNLEREIGSVCRYKAVQYADSKEKNQMEPYTPNVSVEDLEDILGIERFEEEIAELSSRPGIVTGLVAYSTGGQGGILFIEVADMPGNGRVQLTGKLGDVLKESVEVALTWVKAHSFDLGISHDPNEDIMKNRSLHVHCPSGAIPKDGPSAGLAHTIALISLFSGKPVPPQIAMTGEISLRGRVMPVGGIKEKLIGALRAGVKVVMLPYANRKDAKDVPQEVKDGLEIIHVKHIWEALRVVWPQAHFPGQQHLNMLESHL